MSKYLFLKENIHLIQPEITGGIVYRNSMNLLKGSNDIQTNVLEMFQWIQKEKKLVISDEDAAILEQNPELLDGKEKTVLLRKQKKAKKRLKHAEKCATSPVVLNKNLKSTIEEMFAENRYHAVDAVSTLAAFISMMEPDNAVKFLESTHDFSSVWKPVLSPQITFNAVSQVFEVIEDPAKQTKLLSSFWADAHEGRWWDKTSGRKFAANSLRYIEETADSLPETPILSARQIKTKILNRTCDYFPDYQEVVKDIVLNEQDQTKLHRISSDRKVDKDVHLMISMLNVNSMYKPVSPMKEMSQMLLDRSEKVDVSVWKKASGWSWLYPPDGKIFEISERILDLNGSIIDGVEFEIITNAGNLKANAEQMGNCTYSKKGQLVDGSSTMWRAYYNQKIYNAQTSKGNKGTKEIRGVRNSGESLGHVEAAWNKLLKQMT